MGAQELGAVAQEQGAAAQELGAVAHELGAVAQPRLFCSLRSPGIPRRTRLTVNLTAVWDAGLPRCVDGPQPLKL